MKKRLISTLLILLVSLSLSAQHTLVLVSFEKRDNALITEACQQLKAVYGLTTITVVTDRLPASAYYPARHRYRGDSLMNYLTARVRPNTEVIGITDRDISITDGVIKDWGVFGVSTPTLHTGVISGYRLKSRQDVVSTLLHELGHLYGLPHCPTKGCLMEDARGKYLPPSYILCNWCRNKLKK